MIALSQAILTLLLMASERVGESVCFLHCSVVLWLWFCASIAVLVVIIPISLTPRFVLIIGDVPNVLCSLDELSPNLLLPYV